MTMTFGFHAIGAKDEVIEQLEATPLSTGEARFNEFGVELRDLLVKHFGYEADHHGAYEYRYVVKAFGHGGGSVPLSLNLSVEPLYLARARPAEALATADES
jgi:hypothetical protein